MDPVNRRDFLTTLGRYGLGTCACCALARFGAGEASAEVPRAGYEHAVEFF